MCGNEVFPLKNQSKPVYWFSDYKIPFSTSKTMAKEGANMLLPLRRPGSPCPGTEWRKVMAVYLCVMGIWHWGLEQLKSALSLNAVSSLSSSSPLQSVQGTGLSLFGPQLPW